jgi:hypothetical protein
VERKGVYRVFVGKPEVQRPLGRPGRGWKDNIKMDLQEVGLGHGLSTDKWQALVNAVMNLRFP